MAFAQPTYTLLSPGVIFAISNGKITVQVVSTCAELPTSYRIQLVSSLVKPSFVKIFVNIGFVPFSYENSVSQGIGLVDTDNTILTIFNRKKCSLKFLSVYL